MPHTISTVREFEQFIKGSHLSVVHFAAEFVDQCKDVNAVLDALAEKTEFSNTRFFTCAAESLAEVSLKFNVDAAPTVLYFKSGNIIDRVNGADSSNISKKVKEHSNSITKDTPDNISLEEKLKALINRNKVMLFMKGDRQTPRCGFSRQIIEILNSIGIPYDTFDILTDDEVRQGLKTYSDWPTYPQLYINGDLIGGLDIIKEMQNSGELISALNG